MNNFEYAQEIENNARKAILSNLNSDVEKKFAEKIFYDAYKPNGAARLITFPSGEINMASCFEFTASNPSLPVSTSI